MSWSKEVVLPEITQKQRSTTVDPTQLTDLSKPQEVRDEGSPPADGEILDSIESDIAPAITKESARAILENRAIDAIRNHVDQNKRSRDRGEDAETLAQNEDDLLKGLKQALDLQGDIKIRSTAGIDRDGFPDKTKRRVSLSGPEGSPSVLIEVNPDVDSRLIASIRVRQGFDPISTAEGLRAAGLLNERDLQLSKDPQIDPKQILRPRLERALKGGTDELEKLMELARRFGRDPSRAEERAETALGRSLGIALGLPREMVPQIEINLNPPAGDSMGEPGDIAITVRNPSLLRNRNHRIATIYADPKSGEVHDVYYLGRAENLTSNINRPR